MIIGTTATTFGGLMRLGDVIACANVVEHLRQQLGEPELKFNIANSVQPTPYVQEFLAWMTESCNGMLSLASTQVPATHEEEFRTQSYRFIPPIN